MEKPSQVVEIERLGAEMGSELQKSCPAKMGMPVMENGML
jgi:hypothetical protein